jgi:hypothetical protein
MICLHGFSAKTSGETRTACLPQRIAGLSARTAGRALQQQSLGNGATPTSPLPITPLILGLTHTQDFIIMNALTTIITNTANQRSEETLTMSSKEIAELLESRHDKVKQSIERLADRGVIDVPPMGEDQILTSPILPQQPVHGPSGMKQSRSPRLP